jgi:hypothetical protein
MKIEILSVSAIGEVLDKIATTAKALQSQIHQCAVSALAHTFESGDYRSVTRLLNALPNGQRVQALAVWFGAMSDNVLEIKKANGAFSVSLAAGWKDKIGDRAEQLLEVAMEQDYGSFTKESKPTAMTLEKMIKWLESKATASDDDVEPAAKVVAAKLVTSYKAELSKFVATATVQ